MNQLGKASPRLVPMRWRRSVGYSITGREKYILALVRGRIHLRDTCSFPVSKAFCEAIERQIYDGSSEECKRLAKNQAANDRNAQRPP